MAIPERGTENIRPILTPEQLWKKPLQPESTTRVLFPGKVLAVFAMFGPESISYIRGLKMVAYNPDTAQCIIIFDQEDGNLVSATYQYNKTRIRYFHKKRGK